MSSPDPTVTPALSARGVAKTFGGTAALRGTDLIVQAGTIHALLGGNGSGKSTLVKCLAGVHTADAGTVSIAGTTIDAATMTPKRARAAGLRFVHQDLALFDELSVAENFALDSGFPQGLGGRIRWRQLHRHVQDVLADYGIAARSQDLVGALRPSQKTMVAVARALADQVQREYVLLLDEPTATLPERESRELMRALQERADGGQTIVLVSHRLGEVQQIAEALTVFRDGQVVAERTGPDVPLAEIAALLGGTARADTRVRTPAATRDRHDSAVLEVSGLATVGGPGIDLAVGRGEIVGLAGLAGAGKSTVLRSVFGDLPRPAGSMRLAGRPYAPRSPQDAVRAGVGYVPEDRHAEGMFADLTVRENASATVLRRYWRKLVMDGRAEQRDTRRLIEQHAVRTDGTESPMARLSGGNQQKLVLARWTRRQPALLLLDEPTQGVDVVARADIYATLRELAADGCGVLVSSTDLDELLTLCDRVLVLAEGRLAGEFDPITTSREQLVHAVLEGTDAPSSSARN